MADENRKRKPTVFDKLDKIITRSGIEPSREKLAGSSNQYKIGDEILAKTKSKEEWEKKKKEHQQNKYLSNLWRVIDNEKSQGNMQYESTRIAAYSDYENMEWYPEISATLDIMMEEASTPNHNGELLNIYSQSDRVKKILKDLFFNRMDIHTNLPMWIRNVCKYGDNFLFLSIDGNRGVNGVRQLPNYEIERREGDLYNTLMGQGQTKISTEEEESEHEQSVKFHWKGRDINFNSWQVAHFRLLSDDRRLPYGVSVLDKARRIWKQLLLCVTKDTKVWTPEGHREIKDIKRGDTVYSFDPETSELVETKVKTCWKTGDDREIYKIHTRYSDIEVTDNHPILTYDGQNIQYKNINEINKKKDKIFSPTTKDGLNHYEVELDQDNYYIKLNNAGVDHVDVNVEKHGIMNTIKTSVDDQNPKNVHGFLRGNRGIKSNHLNSVKETFEIEDEMIKYYVPNQKNDTLVDNNLKFKTDEEFLRFFGFMLGDGWLTDKGIGFALGEYEEQNDYYINYVRKAFGKNYTYYKPIKGIRGGVIIVHSIELKKIFEKLGFISGFDKKIIPDWVYSMNRENKLSFITGLFDADGSYKWKTIGLSNKKLIEQFKNICQQVGIATGKITGKEGTIKEEDGKLINRKPTYKLYVDLDNVEDLRLENIISIDYIKNDEVWDLEVDHELHNFIANGMVVHNSEDAMLVYRVSRAPERRVFKIYVGNLDNEDVEPFVNDMANRFKRKPMVDPETGQLDLNYNQLASDQDYFIPVRSEDSPNPIETLPGAQNLDEIADIEYLQRKLFTALRVPKTFLGFEEPQGEGKNLALQDIRFSRTINRIQQSIIQELNKVAIVHLYLMGFEDELDNFTITMNNPSTQAEMLKIEHYQQKISAYKDAVADPGNGFGAMSMTRAKKEILGMSDDQIKHDLLEQRMESAAAAELNNTAEIIKHTGLFDDVDQIYGDIEKAKTEGTGAGQDEGGDSPDAGGGGGGISPQDFEFGAEEEGGEEEGGEEEDLTALGAEEEGAAEEGGEETEEGGEEEPTEESKYKNPEKLLQEQKERYVKQLKRKKNKYAGIMFDKLIELSDNHGEKSPNRGNTTKMQDKNFKINEGVDNMINNIDEHLTKDEENNEEDDE